MPFYCDLFLPDYFMNRYGQCVTTCGCNLLQSDTALSVDLRIAVDSYARRVLYASKCPRANVVV